MSFPNALTIAPGMEKATHTSQVYPLGAVAFDIFGNKYRYCFSDGAIGAGQVISQPAPTAANDMDLQVNAASVGDSSITISTSITATKDQYKDGILYVNDGDGEGHSYRIKSNTAVSAASGCVVTLYDNETVREALSASGSSLVGLMPNQWKDAIIYPTTVVGAPLGVATTEVADNEYFWAAVKHEGQATLVEGTLVIGEHVRTSDSTAGAVTALDRDESSAGADDLPEIGVVTGVVAATTDYQYLKLNIPGE